MVEIRFTSHHFSPRYAYSFTDLAVKTSRPLKIGYLKTYSVCKSMKMKPIYHLCILSKSTNFEENNVHEIWHHQIWNCHIYEHKDYNSFISKDNQQL